MNDGTIAALVLRVRPIGESDVMATLMAHGIGKIEALARGARRSKKRFTGGLTVGMRGRATLGKGRGKWAEFSGFIADPRHLRLGRDLEVFAYAHYVCELVDVLVPLGEGADDAYAIADGAILELYDEGAHPLVLRRFELGMLQVLGMAWSCRECAVCGQPLPQLNQSEVTMVANGGGALCEAHALRSADAPTRLPVVLVDIADRLSRGATVSRQEFDAVAGEARRNLRNALFGCLSSHLRAPLQSLTVLGQVTSKGR